MAVVSLPGPIGPASRVFGLTQVEIDKQATDSNEIEELNRQIANAAGHEAIFSQGTVLRDLLSQTGSTLVDLDWGYVDLAQSPAWGDKVRQGDLLQAGKRTVVLFEDKNKDGLLDEGDLCFDFKEGAAIRPLSEVFSGTGDLAWAPLLR